METRSQAREERIELLEEEDRWLKAQLFARSSEKTPVEERHPDQAWLFNEALAQAAAQAPISVTIPAHERGRGGRKKLSAALPRVEVVHDLPDDRKRCAADGVALKRIGEEVSEQLDFKPAQVRVIRNIRPKYACPCCQGNVMIAPVPAQLLPKSLATPSLLAHITTAKFVDGTPLYRQEPQFARLGVSLGRATMAGWMIQLGGVHVMPIVNLLHELMLSDPLIHFDETRLQVLKSDNASTADDCVILGPRGVGKNHLAVGLGMKATEAGYHVFFTTAANMIAVLTRALAEGRLEEKLKHYTVPPCATGGTVAPVGDTGANDAAD